MKRRHKTQDTISMLVNIYGSSELFVNEYRTMLADRLLSITDYDTDKEVYFETEHSHKNWSRWVWRYRMRSPPILSELYLCGCSPDPTTSALTRAFSYGLWYNCCGHATMHAVKLKPRPYIVVAGRVIIKPTWSDRDSSFTLSKVCRNNALLTGS